MLPSPLLSDPDERITRIRFFARNQSLTGAKYCWTILAVGIGCRASMARMRSSADRRGVHAVRARPGQYSSVNDRR